MTIPLIVLAVGAIVAGYIGLPAWLEQDQPFEHFLEPVFEPLPYSAAAEATEYSHAFEVGMAAVSVAVALIGFLLAYFEYYKKSSWRISSARSSSIGSVYPVAAEQVLHG